MSQWKVNLLLHKEKLTLATEMNMANQTFW